MTLTTYAWERPLLNLAYEADPHHLAGEMLFQQDHHLLESSHDHCKELTRFHSRSFYMASQLLGPAKRRAVRALYAFCRMTDDIVDFPENSELPTLEDWRERALTWHPPVDDAIAVAWADARSQYHIPRRYAEQLMEGVARDLHQNRYETFSDLATYCYGVASTVGLMSMHIIGFESEKAIPYAIKLGVALQLTNILRDVAEDWERGRFYLPLEELHEFDLTEEDVARGVVDDRWRAFMQFQIKRTRQLYVDAWPGIDMLNREGRLAIAAAAGFYQEILTDIERHDYDNFSRRAHVSQWGKLRLLPKLWWQTR
ncbi:MAG: squalene/phytoene synthase family protein [Anaerolineales bacterium]|nr:squalene/phytoene synthase family protein [Anaerolineales bacterium]